MKKLLVGVLMTLLVVSGCGAKDTSNGETTGAATEAADEKETEATKGEGLTVAAIQEAGVLHVGTDLTFEPYEYLDDDENPVGYDVEIWQKIAEDMGVEVDFEDMAFSGIFAGLEAGKFDVAGCYANVTEERMEKYKFCYPIAYDEFYLVKRAGDDSITSVEDADGKTVGVKLGSAPATALEEYSATLENGVTETNYDASTSAFLDLTNGNVDLACESYTICKQEVDASEGALEIVGSISTPVYGSFAFRPEDSELADYVSSEIKKFKEDGTLEELQIKYFGATFDELPEDESEYIK